MSMSAADHDKFASEFLQMAKKMAAEADEKALLLSRAKTTNDFHAIKQSMLESMKPGEFNHLEDQQFKECIAAGATLTKADYQAMLARYVEDLCWPLAPQIQDCLKNGAAYTEEMWLDYIDGLQQGTGRFDTPMLAAMRADTLDRFKVEIKRSEMISLEIGAKIKQKRAELERLEKAFAELGAQITSHQKLLDEVQRPASENPYIRLAREEIALLAKGTPSESFARWRNAKA